MPINSHLFLSLFTLLLLLVSCSEEPNTTITKEVITSQKQLSKEDIIKKAERYIESFLKINATEDYTLTHSTAYLDNDTLKDYVFLVNREDYALEKVKQENNEKFFEYLGRTGPHNHVFVYLTGEGIFLDSPPVGSSVAHPLTVSFDYITAPSRQDFWVEYRTRNSLHRNYYTVKNKKLYLTFNCPVFDNIGDPKPKAYHIEHKESDVRIAKDIYIYHGTIANYNPEEIDDINNFTPDSIIGSEDLFVFFLFDEKQMVYKTPFKREEVKN